MHINEKNVGFIRYLRTAESILSAFFWILVILGFDEPYAAVITLISVVIHEGGHSLAAWCLQGRTDLPRGRLLGLRMRVVGTVGYGAGCAVYASGAAANFLAAAVALPFLGLAEEYVSAFAVINLASGVTNLLPIEGYDGYGIIRTLLDCMCAGAAAYRILEAVSFTITATLTFLSLIFIYEIGEGYWMFAAFAAATFRRCSKWLSEVKSEDFEDFGRF